MWDRRGWGVGEGCVGKERGVWRTCLKLHTMHMPTSLLALNVMFSVPDLVSQLGCFL